MATALQIQQLYVAYFGRPADPAGLDYWVSTGISTKDFAAAMYAQPEFQQANANLPVVDQVNALYLNLFGRSGDTEGLLYWTQQINTGKLTLASIANDLIFAANNNPSAQSQLDLIALNNKTATAIAYTGDVRETSASLVAYNATSTTPWVTGPQFTSAVNYLATVTQTAPTAAATQASVDAMTAIGTAGQTFTLTTNVDTATANVFNGGIQITGNFALNTLNNGDQLTGSGVNSTLNLTYAENAAGVTPALLSGINTANIEFNTTNGAAGTPINWNNGTGLTAVSWSNAVSANALNNLAGALSTLSISNTAAAQTFGFTNAALSAATNALALTASSVTGGNALNLNTATAGAATSNYETVNVTSNGVVTNVFNITQNSGGLTTLNVSGSAGFTTVNPSANLVTLNASTATGQINYTENGAVGNASYTTGAANDTINLVATLTANDTVSGGNGTDTLRANIAAIDSGLFSIAANTANISGIEILSINNDASGGTGIVNANLFAGVNRVTYRVAAAGNVTLNTPSGAFTVNDNVTGGIAGNFTVDAAGTGLTDALTFVADSGGAGAVAYGGNITFTDYETVTWNITDPTGATVAGTFQVNPNIGAVGVLNITGSVGAVFTGAVTASTLNASALSVAGISINGGMAAASNVTGSGFADSILGSGGNDIISGGAGNDTLQGGGGQDSISLGAGQDVFEVRSTTANGTALNALASGTAVGDFVTGLTAATTDTIQIGIAAASALTDAAGTPLIATSTANVLAVASGSTINISASTANIIKLVGSTSTTAANTGKQGFTQAMNGATLTVGLAANDDLTFVYYDSANAQAVLGIINDTTGTTIASANADDVWTTLGKISMTAADYANLSTINFAAFIA